VTPAHEQVPLQNNCVTVEKSNLQDALLTGALAKGPAPPSNSSFSSIAPSPHDGVHTGAPLASNPRT
jgi:hypothetical protein